mmetsp:Transcript_11403/g.15552  ORF Transcript_11403/g.15552 Transcript_11403/m.15552 type:complete len:164 (-) Transcript_11403:345-836(-)|eukprot:CAMPEP_0196588894 /NCGR_PEP_ID=MMETSP1081-20130531/62025_1 /TAXON_ID=36882 /ORGANISM="Pyramimonas amylifera, Strain CCMP720" /LENGTH=163 /DNA_ID=CAMNT_0041911527 /DNA_START=227 /DNA_END=718 /DNA_ORIENTATION=-
MEIQNQDEKIPLKSDQVARLRHWFSKFDFEGSGNIKLSELDNLLRALGMTLNKQEFQSALQKIGMDFSTSAQENVTFNMFLALWQPVSQSSSRDQDKDKLRLAFNVMDREGRGKITDHDFRNILMQADFQLSPETLDDLVRATDLNGDGDITFNALRCVLIGD